MYLCSLRRCSRGSKFREVHETTWSNLDDDQPLSGLAHYDDGGAHHIVRIELQAGWRDRAVHILGNTLPNQAPDVYLELETPYRTRQRHLRNH